MSHRGHIQLHRAKLSLIIWQTIVVLLYSDISNLTFWNELGNFKQKRIIFQNAFFFYILQQWTLFTLKVFNSFFVPSTQSQPGHTKIERASRVKLPIKMNSVLNTSKITFPPWSLIWPNLYYILSMEQHLFNTIQ